MRRRPLAHLLLRHADAELRRLARVRGAYRRTARRRAEAAALVALAAALVGAEAARAQPLPPLFLNPFHPFGWNELGPDPLRFAFADLDGDGDLDALANSGGFPFLIRNDGTRRRPVFAEPVSAPFGIAALDFYAVPALADLDGDGDLDLLLGQPTGATTLLPNTGSSAAPAFGAETTLSGVTNVSAYAAPAAPDLDGDGDLDLLVGDADGHLTLFVNTAGAGAASFATGVIDPLGLGDFYTFAVPALADLDGDGDLDLYVGQGAGTVVFSENTGTATAPGFLGDDGNPFGLEELDNGRAAPAFADLDDDGDLDALVADGAGLTVYFENTGNRLAPAFRHAGKAFGIATQIAGAPAFGDLDGDGDLDALFGNLDGDLIATPNTGTRSSPAFGEPAPAAFGLALDPSQITAPTLGDIDGDGDLDVLVGNDVYGGQLALFVNTGTAAAAAFGAPQVDPFCGGSLGPRPSPELVDLDVDGDLDLAIVYDDGRIDYCANTGSATAPAFAPPETNPFALPVVATPPHFAFGDLQGNDIVDAIYGDDEGNLNVVFNSGTTATPTFVAFDGTSFGLPPIGGDVHPALADLDADGDPDVVAASFFGTERVTFVENLTERWLCAPAPRALCAEFAGGTLTVDERKPGKEKLVLSLAGGPELAPAALGAPLEAGGNAYALCVYDQAGARVANLEVERAGETCGTKPCWKGTAKGFAYADKAAEADGVTSLVLKGGAAGRSKLTAAGSNHVAKGRAALPTGLAAQLADATLVTVQVATAGGACFSAELDEVKKQTPTLFKAR